MIYLPYCDGSSFTSYRRGPWPVNSTALHFRGRSNLDRAMDYLLAHYGLGRARDLILYGGSAGGLATFLNADRVAARLPP